MGWINFRIALAYLIPGFIPLIFFVLTTNNPEYKMGSYSAEEITLAIIAGIAIGMFIDLFKHLVEKTFINWCNLTFIKVFFKKLFRRKKLKKPNWTLKQQNADYEEKVRETINFWIAYQIDKKKLTDKIHANEVMKKEYYEALITSGDRWALINILESDTTNFMIQDYFTYYQFSFNSFISLILTTIFSCILYSFGLINYNTFWWTLLILGILILFLHERTVFWLLATRRFSRKIILYSMLKDDK
jgi:hypothetical protein